MTLPKLTKKYKYLILSVVTVGLLFWFSYAPSHGIQRELSAIITFLVGIVGTLWCQYSSEFIKEAEVKAFILETILSVIVLPVVLGIGAILSLFYFPNLGLPTKIAAIGGVGLVMYITQLVTNIFLVVYDKKEQIPLFRVASTWSQILVITIAIPFYAGIFKLPLIAPYQSLIVGVTAALFALFLSWSMRMDTDVTGLDRGEVLFNVLLVGFIIFASSISVSFFPSESFLRSLFVSSTLMFALGYMGAHYKNAITKKLVFEYLLIVLAFCYVTF